MTRAQAPRARWPRLLAWPAGLLGAAAFVTYLYRNDPHQPGAYPTCFLRSTTGLACPGCGGTRAAYDLLHGDVSEAMQEHALLLPLLLVVGVLLVRSLWRRRDPDARGGGLAPTGIGISVAVAFLVFGIVRNLPGLEVLQPL